MIAPLLLALATPVTVSAAAPCIPPVTQDAPQSALADHQALRATLSEPLPRAATMVMLFGSGGHLSTVEYSIVLARGEDGVWRGTAVGRSQIWIKDAPFNPMNRREWVLDKDKGRALDAAIARRCPAAAPVPADTARPLAPVAERIDVIRRGAAIVTFRAPLGQGTIATLLRPPS